jgi:glutamate dehydrogenase (NAD(P)+)
MNTASLLPPQSELDTCFDPYISATADLERSARLLDLEDWIVERLRHCEQESVINFLLSGDEGHTHSLTGLWVRHCAAAGPVAAPFQISRDAYRNSVCADAMRMTWLCALYGLRHGGAAAALIVNPHTHSEKELRRAVRGFAESAGELVGSAALVYPAGVHPVEMDWLDAGLRTIAGEHVQVAGKSKLSSGEQPEDHVADGVAELIRCATGSLKLRVAMQGFDSSSRRLVQRLYKSGARVVAVADESGGVRHELGLDPWQTGEYVEHHGVLLGYPDGEQVLNADVLETDCDVLVLAGGARQIGSHNVSRIAARVIVEVARNAIVESAMQELAGVGKIIVSNLLCAGPALLQAVAETEQDSPGRRRTALIRRVVRDTWKSVSEAAQHWNVSIPQAARTTAIQRVAAILRAQGLSL